MSIYNRHTVAYLDSAWLIGGSSVNGDFTAFGIGHDFWKIVQSITLNLKYAGWIHLAYLIEFKDISLDSDKSMIDCNLWL